MGMKFTCPIPTRRRFRNLIAWCRLKWPALTQKWPLVSQARVGLRGFGGRSAVQHHPLPFRLECGIGQGLWIGPSHVFPTYSLGFDLLAFGGKVFE